jgi:GNAT superfamily N-acetyltransferase
MIVTDLFESHQTCPKCGGPAFSDLVLAEKKDACYSKVRSRYKVWPSAYASGALVQCRKKGAANWGNKSEGVAEAGPVQGEYSRVLTALRLYYPRFEIEELNTPDWHRVIANKANVTPEYAGQVIDDFVKASQPDEEENLDWMDDTNDVREGVAEEFGPLPKDNQQIRLGRHTVDIERVGRDKDYFSFAWHDSQGQEHYQEVPVGDLDSYDDLIKKIKQEISYQERQYTDQGVAEGLPQTLRKVVPGHAKREIDKKMDAGKFGKTDADKDANFQRYKKIQDKLKEQGVAEGLNEMDKSQTPPGRDGDIDWTKKQIHLGPEHVIKAKDVAKHALKALDKTMKKSHADTPKKKGVAEAINPDITNPAFSHQQQIGDYLYVARYWSKGLKITAYDGAKQIGYAELMYQSAPFDDFADPKTTPKRIWLESEWTRVDPKYQRQGIMSTMYAYAKMLGNSVKPSQTRSDDAKAAWKSWRDAGDAQHLTREGVAEGGYGHRNPDLMSPGDYDRYQQDQMDHNKRDFKRREHEAEWEQEKAYSEKLAARDAGTWYIRINGKLLKDRQGQPYTFQGKAAANRAAATMMAKPFNAGKQFTLTTTAADRT